MTIDEIVLLLKASQASTLTVLQEIVLRSSWEGKTYTNIAAEAHYGEERVRKVASLLWQSLTDFFQETINKANFRQIIENRRLTKAQNLLIKEYHRTNAAISIEFPGGPVTLDSRFYIYRPPLEEQAFAEIEEPGSVICIKAPKRMGKSSLILRVLDHANKQGYKTVTVDFQQADRVTFTSLDKFLRWFCANISRELGLEPKLNDYWDEEMGSKVSCSIYFQEYILPSLTTPLVLALNEVDWVLEHPEIVKDFFPLLRSWYEQGRRIEIWQKLRIVLAYSTELIVSLKLSQSPFNIGLSLKLEPFTKVQIQSLAQRHGVDWADDSQIDKLMAMVGGHPYLVRLALYHLVGKGGLEGDLKQLLQQAPGESSIYHEYFKQYVLALKQERELEEAFARVIATKSAVKLPMVVAYKLQSMGLINLDGDKATPACELYRLYFKNQLSTNEHNNLELVELSNYILPLQFSLDGLTQLANRRYFNSYLQQSWQSLANRLKPLALILCDIDYFKFYNKTYGQTAGDDCLIRIGNIINNSIKTFLEQNNLSLAVKNITNTVVSTVETSNNLNSLLVARYSGEQFAILAQTDEATAIYLAEKIREQVKILAIPCQYPGIGGLPANVLTVSLGVATAIPNHDSEPNSIVHLAERGLNQAKRRGRDRVSLGTDDLEF
jgi:GGDEF domain-containing protein